MMRKLAAFCFTVACGSSNAQTTATLPAFDAVSVKHSNATDDGSSWHSRTGYIVMKNQTLRNLVAIAWRMPADRISGGPKWADADRFDIEGRAPSAAHDPEILLMLQRTLSERFQVVVHQERAAIDGYALVPIKTGLKIKPDDESQEKSKSHSSRGKIEAERITMPKLAETLGRLLGKPVIDSTGIKGGYTFTLEWTPEPPRTEGAASTDPAGPTLFDVVASKLGLKLENKKLPSESLVIDKAEKPNDN
ncbi:MAG TPA: TIGR03435 family protein [Candidatus Solibacter sp.]|nr:TIGR03435 family protein [Candidatus Solibacter sp.]